MNMTFRDLKEAVNSVRLHPLSTTNVVEVGIDRGQFLIGPDPAPMDDLRRELEEARDDVKTANKEAEEADTRAEEAERRLNEAEELLARIKDGSKTLRDYVLEAEHAQELANKWSERVGKAEAELTALRKRKGIIAGYFAMYREIIAALHDCRDTWAQDLVKKLHAFK